MHKPSNRWMLTAVGLCATLLTSSLASPNSDQAFDRAIAQWQLPAAIAQVPPLATDPEQLRKKGVVAFHRGDYETTIDTLRTAIPGLAPKRRDETKAMLARAQAAQALFRDRPLHKSQDGQVRVIFSNPKDELLAPYFFEAIKDATPRLVAALGPLPSVPARFEFIQSPADLAKITNLPLDAIYTTGTIGITKYHRVMMASPRITLTGYEWLDTAVHEYVHFLVSIRTFNRTPVWLHEGLAKFYESSWRSATPPPISRTQASLLDTAFRENRLVTLEQMHPSIALLPSQSQAALAYAQVQTMIAFLQASKGPGAIASVLSQVAAGADAATAFGRSYKKGWDAFYADWKQHTAKQVAKMRKKAFVPQRFNSNGPASFPAHETPPDVFSRLESGPARKHARLAALLAERGHEAQAILHFERALKSSPEIAKDPKLARRLGELYLDQDRGAIAYKYLSTASLEDPHDAYLATLQAQAALALGRKDLASKAAKRALAQNPMIPQLHCLLGELSEDPVLRAHEESYCGQSLDEQDAPPK